MSVFNLRGEGAAHSSDPVLITLRPISRKIFWPHYMCPHYKTLQSPERDVGPLIFSIENGTPASVLVKQQNPAVWFRKDVRAVTFTFWVKKKLKLFGHYLYPSSKGDSAVHTSVLDLHSEKTSKANDGVSLCT